MKKIVLVIIILLASTLRLYKLGSNPPALYWDEASLGYNAYSILKTGHDEHGKFMPLTNFAAFGDYKPPGYIYATVPALAIFGLNEFAIRFPSAFFGILTVLTTYLISKRIFKNEIVSLLSALFLAISPWHLQFSRGAFEANLGLFFSTLGIYFFLMFEKEKPLMLLASILSFIAAMYTFTGQRLFVPFILLILFIQFKKRILENLKIVAISLILGAFIFWPLFKFATGTIEGRLRFDEVTIFKDLKPIEESTKYRQRENFSAISGIIHNRRIFYAREYLIHYFDAFNPAFLFTRGDANPRLSIQEVGELYYIDLPLILIGIYFLFKTKQKYRLLLIGWLLVSPLGPATARETPHALRMIHILPTFQLIAAFGLYNIYQVVKFKRTLIAFTVFLLTLNFVYYLHMYYLHWPKEYSGQWQYGYKQAVMAVAPHFDKYEDIVVTKALGRPYIYFLLYTNYDPEKYQQTAQVTRDQFYFLDVEGFDKYYFVGSIDSFPKKGKTLYVTQPESAPKDSRELKIILDTSGKPVLRISEE